MTDLLLAIIVTSVLLSALALFRARRLHCRIERHWPGFNARMKRLTHAHGAGAAGPRGGC